MSLVHAVVINHNTSLFSQLALRSLVATVGADPAVELRTTVLDNHSDDPEVATLQALCADLGVTFELSRWPVAGATVNTHGDVLRDFVLEHSDAEYFLLVDADIDFEETGTIDAMLSDLEVADDLWAVQARFRWTEENKGEGASLDIRTDERVSLRVGRMTDEWEHVEVVRGSFHGRCHPGATLVRNSETFQRVAEFVGFSCAYRMSQEESHAGFLDTFGLASAAMTAAGYRYELSRATVHHFFMASYDEEHIEPREKECRRRLSRFSVTPT